VTADVTLAQEDLASLYDGAFFAGHGYADYIADRSVIQRNFRRRLRTVTRYVPHGVLIEVGCAHGFFLDLARTSFDVRGYEVSLDAARYARDVIGVPVTSADFLSDKNAQPGSADAIAMWDVIEHLESPERVVERCAWILRPGGHLFVTTGDRDAWLPRFQAQRWRLICPPIHLHYFSRDTLSRLLRRTGFDIVEVDYPGCWRSVREILHGLFILGREDGPSTLYGVLRRILPLSVAVYLNTFDIMCVVARRR
jgi:SAM-dependent methyltransferase